MNAEPGTAAAVRVAVVTGTRAEYGLLRPVIRAIADHPRLEPRIIVTGAHFLPPAETWREVEAEWENVIAARVPMQRPEGGGHLDDAEAVGRGICGIAAALRTQRPSWVVVLGDRIEAFAGASAAAIGGIAVAHLHGGDRAEGVADESLRHAITKLAHLHLPATAASAERILRMGEDPRRVVIVGSPAIDGLGSVAPADDQSWDRMGRPTCIALLHPIGDAPETERARAAQLFGALHGERVLWLHPNYDPGREGVLQAGADAVSRSGWVSADHIPREQFIGVLKRLASSGGVMVGNSSAGLIECAALGVPAVDVGERQGGRERPGNVVHVDGSGRDEIVAAIAAARRFDRPGMTHPYGDGHSGTRAAAALAATDPTGRGFLRKRCTY